MSLSSLLSTSNRLDYSTRTMSATGQTLDESLATLQLAPAVPTPSSTLPSSAPPPPKRITRQALSDELRADEEGTVPGAPSRNGGRFLTDDSDPWAHNAW